MIRLPAVVTLVCLLSVVIYAQAGLNGKWQGTTPQGRQVTLDLKVKGKQLTGTFALDENVAPITGGIVDGNTFSFKASRGGESLAFTGKLAADRIELESDGPIRALTLERIK